MANSWLSTSKHCGNRSFKCPQVSVCKDWIRGDGSCKLGPSCQYSHLAICPDADLGLVAESAFLKMSGRSQRSQCAVPIQILAEEARAIKASRQEQQQQQEQRLQQRRHESVTEHDAAGSGPHEAASDAPPLPLSAPTATPPTRPPPGGLEPAAGAMLPPPQEPYGLPTPAPHMLTPMMGPLPPMPLVNPTSMASGAMPMGPCPPGAMPHLPPPHGPMPFGVMAPGPIPWMPAPPPALPVGLTMPPPPSLDMQNMLHMMLEMQQQQQQQERGQPMGVSQDSHTSDAKTVPESALNLRNEAGEYNCFLNVIIQALWHLQPFREAMREVRPMRLSGHLCRRQHHIRSSHRRSWICQHSPTATAPSSVCWWRCRTSSSRSRRSGA